ncbi:MAG: DUF4252 domain-containing protein [Candidatus Latescibacteria bacterium]|nr:DUF4252 domain-containing protein [Candidatus Latescibacterota bacterium]
MSRKELSRVIPGLLVAVLCSGCFRAAELARMQREIEQELPEIGFEKEVELGLGPLSMWCIRSLCLLAPNSGEARGYLGEVDQVQVVAYRTLTSPSLASFQLPPRLQHTLKDQGWELVIKSREKGEITWVFCRVHHQAICGLYVVSLDPEELVLVRVDGNLEQMAAQAVENPRSIKP